VNGEFLLFVFVVAAEGRFIRPGGHTNAETTSRERRGARGGNMVSPTRFALQTVLSDPFRTVLDMEQPTRIDLLELDIDLRLTDLWREAADVPEWSLEVVSAFMRACYGKGYCDALTEDAPGSLCREHGYEVPPRREPVGRRHASADAD